MAEHLSQYLQVQNPDPVFNVPEGKDTSLFCKKLMQKTDGFTEVFAFDIASAFSCASGKRKRKPPVLRRRAISALLNAMCFYYDPLSNTVLRTVTELALECGLARKAANGHLSIERAVRAIKSLEEDFGFITCLAPSEFHNTQSVHSVITFTPRLFEYLGVSPLALIEARLVSNAGGIVSKNTNPLHWSQLDTEEQIRFWQGVDDGLVDSFLVAPVKKRTRRRRGEHSTKPKCENPSWFRPARYKKLSGQLGHAYNRLVMIDPDTGESRLRMHMSLHPLYVRERQRAGRKYAFRPEKGFGE